VVSDHRGKIAVVSAPGAGATFVIDLPALQDQQA
jgi:signal transduction histidine kinase